MKKIISNFLIFSFVLLIISCNTYEETNTTRPIGTFIELNDAYKQQLISDDDLLNIAYYHSSNHKVYNTSKNEVEIDKTKIKEKEILSKEIEKLIIEDCYYYVINSEWYKESSKDGLEENQAKLEAIKIKNFYGQYNDYKVILMEEYDFRVLAAVEGEEFIGDYYFSYPYKGGNRIQLWKEN